MRRLVCALAAVLMVVVASAATAGPILIVNGAASTSEPSTTANITNNLTTLHIAAGNTVTVSSDIPVDLTGYSQVWDIRFDNAFALTGAQQSQYLGFLQGGGGMFLMGENDGFTSRNNSIFSFVSAAGGGSLGGLIGGCDGVQAVNAPFTGPNPVSSVNYACSGVVASPGTGAWITSRVGAIGGSGVAWGSGDLANAPTGALTTIFDVNFMENQYGIDQQNLTKNLIQFIEDEGDPEPAPVPEPGTLTLIGGGLALSAYRRRRSAK
jgi:hypothetical protein